MSVVPFGYPFVGAPLVVKMSFVVHMMLKFFPFNLCLLLVFVVQVLTVVSQDQSGWWTGEKGGRKGLFPSNYVNLI